MSTSDGLHMAKTFDKTGKRTIGVITKVIKNDLLLKFIDRYYGQRN